MDSKKLRIHSDSILIKGLKNKDDRAFSDMIQRYRSSVFLFLFNMVKDSDDAEDLMMITFEKVFINIDNYFPKFTFSTWLFRIARNTGLDFIKVRNNRYRLIDNFILSEQAINPYSPDREDEMIYEEEMIILKKNIRSMDLKYRTIIILRYVFGYSFKEIEQKYGIKVNLALQQIRRAKILLKDSLVN